MRGRFWQTTIAILILLVQGFFDLSPVLAVASATPSAVQTAEKEEAVAVCRCMHCKDEKRCCCKTAENSADAIVLTAVCDTPQDTIHQQTMLPRALPSSCQLLRMPDAVFQPTPVFATIPLLIGRTPAPTTHPPCLG